MDLSQLISDAWALTRRHRSLWLLALFAGLPAGNCGVNNLGQMNRGGTSSADDADTSRIRETTADVRSWLGDHAGLVAAIVLAVFLIWLLFFVVGAIAQGGLTRATLELASGRNATLGQAWTAGVASFWPFLRLRLLAILVIVPFAVLGGVIGVLVARGGVSGGVASLIALAGVLGLLVGIPFGVVLSFAMRALVTEGDGATDAFREGWRLFRANVGQSLLLWLVNIAFVAAIMIAAFITAVLIILPLVGIGFAIGLTMGAAGLIPYLAVTGALAFAVFLLMVAITSSFSWHFWTLGYLRLRSQTAAA